MTKVHPLPESLLHPSDVDLYRSIHTVDPEESHHLIVLLSTDLDYPAILPRICGLASKTNSSVQFLGLYRDSAEELALRREMVTAAALIRDASIPVDITIQKGTNWVEVIRNHYQPGDIILCIAEQPTGIRRRPLHQVLESSLSAPIYILSDPSLQPQSDSHWLSDLTSWAGSIAIIAGAFLLQIQIVSITTNWAQTTLLLLSIAAEIGLIGLWNSLFG